MNSNLLAQLLGEKWKRGTDDGAEDCCSRENRGCIDSVGIDEIVDKRHDDKDTSSTEGGREDDANRPVNAWVVGPCKTAKRRNVRHAGDVPSTMDMLPKEHIHKKKGKP